MRGKIKYAVLSFPLQMVSLTLDLVIATSAWFGSSQLTQVDDVHLEVETHITYKKHLWGTSVAAKCLGACVIDTSL